MLVSHHLLRLFCSESQACVHPEGRVLVNLCLGFYSLDSALL